MRVQLQREKLLFLLLLKIWIDYSTVTIEYTIPINKDDNSDKEILVFTNADWGGLIRTSSKKSCFMLI